MPSHSHGSNVSTLITWGFLGYPSPRAVSPHLTRSYLNVPCQHTFFFVQGNIMYSINVVCSGFLLISTASTLAIGPSQTLITLMPGPSSIANLTTDAQVNGQVNLTLNGLSQNGAENYDIQCSAAVYGRGLKSASCASAINSFIQPFRGWVTIGPRGKGKAYNYVLPWRWISGTLLRSPSCGVMY